MFLLALCLIGTAAAAPAIPEAPILPPESHVLVSPYFSMSYPAPLAPLRTLDIMIEPEPKEEKTELPEPEEEFSETGELKETAPLAPEEPKEEPKPAEPVDVKLEIPKPPSFSSIANWFGSLLPPNSFSWPNIQLPPFITNILPSSSDPKPPRILYPTYYAGYPGAVIVDTPKP